MLYVCIFVELLSSRPALTVTLAALLQAALWTLIPTLFYAAPPGDLPFVLAIGHEWQLGTWLGPPLAFWLAEAAFVLAGNSLAGVYLLSQICVLVTFAAMFALGRSLVSAQHAGLAVLAMAGVTAFTAPTPEFGPAMLSMPLWALMLLHYWRAVAEGRRIYWLALALEAGLLLLTAYAGLVLISLLLLFTAGNRQARRAVRAADPWLAGILVLIVMGPHLLWLWLSGDGPIQLGWPKVLDNVASALRQTASLVAGHAGLVLLVLAVAGWRPPRGVAVPVLVRAPASSLARQFVLFFAIAPALTAIVVAMLGAPLALAGATGPLPVLSGLAVVILAGNAIALRRQYLAVTAWFMVLLLPPLLTVVAIHLLPWLGIDLNINKPAAEIARVFSDSFQRRTGLPLRIVAGDPRSAALIGLGAGSRPRLLLDAAPERTPWVTLDDARRQGAVLIWPAADTAGTPPASLTERFPDLVPDATTQLFQRRITGRLPPLRYGWAVIRPGAGPPAEAGPARQARDGSPR